MEWCCESTADTSTICAILWICMPAVCNDRMWNILGRSRWCFSKSQHCHTLLCLLLMVGIPNYITVYAPVATTKWALFTLISSPMYGVEHWCAVMTNTLWMENHSGAKPKQPRLLLKTLFMIISLCCDSDACHINPSNHGGSISAWDSLQPQYVSCIC